MEVFFIDYYKPNDNNGICAYRKNLLFYFSTIPTIRVFAIYVNCSICSQIEKKTNEDGIVSIYVPFDIVSNRVPSEGDHLLADYIMTCSKEKEVILHLNWMNHSFFGSFLKSKMNIRVILTKHCVCWREDVLNDYSNYMSIQSKLENECGSSINIYESQRLKDELTFFSIVDHTITVTKDASNILKVLYKISQNQITCVYNGIDLDDGVSLSKQSLREKYGFAINDKIVLYVGGLSVYKGLTFLYPIIDILRDTIPTIRLIVCGEGAFQFCMISLPDSLKGRVSFLGNVPKNKLYELYHLADMGIVPSINEQCSYVALEMMRAGLPLMISNVPGLRELNPADCDLIFEINFLSEKFTINAINTAQKIKKVLTDTKYASDVSTKQHQRLATFHTVDRMGKKTLEVYESLFYKESNVRRSISKTSDPLVSVIIPCYNAESFISETIRSVLSQTYPNYEIIIIDDASNDKTVEIIKGFDNVKIHLMCNKKNKGIVYCLNKAIAYSSGQYIARLDADDMMMPNRLIEQVNYLESHPEYAIVGGSVLLTNENNFPIGIIRHPEQNDNIKWMRFFFNPFVHSSVLLRRSALPTHAYQKKYLHCEDYFLWMHLCDQHKAGNIPIVIGTYRLNKNGLSWSNRNIQP